MDYEPREDELLRVDDALSNLPEECQEVLEIGARYGYVTRRLAERYTHVTALDLEKPDVQGEKITPVQGDVTSLDFADKSFDLVVCMEVLEHIETTHLERACRELMRVSKQFVLIGVPYKQDIRAARTRCQACGRRNPPFGHVNAFSRQRLESLFQGFDVEKVSLVGSINEKTNFLSARLMDLSGNFYGTYHQKESCIYCGSRLERPTQRSFYQKVLTKSALALDGLQRRLSQPQPRWIHILFRRPQ